MKLILMDRIGGALYLQFVLIMTSHMTVPRLLIRQRLSITRDTVKFSYIHTCRVHSSPRPAHLSNRTPQAAYSVNSHGTP